MICRLCLLLARYIRYKLVTCPLRVRYKLVACLLFSTVRYVRYMSVISSLHVRYVSDIFVVVAVSALDSHSC